MLCMDQISQIYVDLVYESMSFEQKKSHNKNKK